MRFCGGGRGQAHGHAGRERGSAFGCQARAGARPAARGSHLVHAEHDLLVRHDERKVRARRLVRDGAAGFGHGGGGGGGASVDRATRPGSGRQVRKCRGGGAAARGQGRRARPSISLGAGQIRRRRPVVSAGPTSARPALTRPARARRCSVWHGGRCGSEPLRPCQRLFRTPWRCVWRCVRACVCCGCVRAGGRRGRRTLNAASAAAKAKRVLPPRPRGQPPRVATWLSRATRIDGRTTHRRTRAAASWRWPPRPGNEHTA